MTCRECQDTGVRLVAVGQTNPYCDCSNGVAARRLADKSRSQTFIGPMGKRITIERPEYFLLEIEGEAPPHTPWLWIAIAVGVVVLIALAIAGSVR